MKFWILIALAIAVPAQAGEPQFEYTSPHVNLHYAYSTSTGAPDGPVDHFEVFSPSGSVAGEIKRLSDGSERIVLIDGTTFATAAVIIAAAKPLSARPVDLELSDAGGIHFEYDDGRQSMKLSSSTPPPCAELSRSAALEALRATFVTLNQDVDLHYPEIPPHLVDIASAIGLARGLPGLIAKCRGAQDPLAGGCYYDHPTFEACVGCCNGAGVFGALCRAFVTCPDLSCRVARIALCGGIRHLSIVGCIGHNCVGKPGDPSCTPPKPPCPGTCMQFCGPGHSSECGTCPTGLDCCTP